MIRHVSGIDNSYAKFCHTCGRGVKKYHKGHFASAHHVGVVGKNFNLVVEEGFHFLLTQHLKLKK